MATHNLEPNADTLHGFFSPEQQPVLMIDPGDTVRFRTLDASWGLENFGPKLPEQNNPHRRIASTRHGEPSGHALCGPVAIRGAEPGMALAIRIDALRTGTWGWTIAPIERTGTRTVLHRWTLDPNTLTAVNQHGHRVRLRPFMGVMGVAPNEPGRHSTLPPRPTGGNIDCKELVVGSTLYLPVAVPGALFSVGDGHGLQGDGEASGTAIECPMDLVELTFTLHEDLHLHTPRAETPAGWLTFGFSFDLGEAARIALNAMLDLMGERHGLARADAMALASLVVDLRITQVVNGINGVHAVLPHDAL